MVLRFAGLLVMLLATRVAWSQQTQSSPPAGQAIFMERCAKCHGEQGQGITGFINYGGPNIQAVHNPGDVMMAMEVGPSHMPQFAYVLSVAEMRAVAKYVTEQIAVIPLKGGQISRGGELFRVYCGPCHRTAVRGGVMVYTGVNAPNLSKKSPAIIAGAIRWGPGDMPSFPKTVISDEDLASIVKYVQFVQQPPAPGGSPINWYGPVAEGFVAWVILFAIIATTGWIEKGGKG